jgi:uncharacterized protein
MSVPEFSVPIHDLDAAGKHQRFPVRAAWVRAVLEGEEEIAPAGPDGELDIRVSKSGNDVVVHGHLKAELQAACARCLSPAKIVIDQPVSVLMVPAGHAKSSAAKGDEEEIELSDLEADVVPYEGDTIVLD